MNSVVEYRRRDDVTQSPVGSGSGGGGVDDDISKRLGNVESEVRVISANISHLATAKSVGEISSVIPHLATKADLKAEIGCVNAEIGSVRTEIAGVRTAIAEVRTELASMETKIIKWIIATVLATAGVVFSITKFVHLS